MDARFRLGFLKNPKVWANTFFFHHINLYDLKGTLSFRLVSLHLKATTESSGVK
jgi:hypothetical protein